MALNQSTWQSATGTLDGIVGESDLAVDGDNSTDWSQGSCSFAQITSSSSAPWLAVDLGRMTHVYSVQLTNIANRSLGTSDIQCIDRRFAFVFIWSSVSPCELPAVYTLIFL
jgi:hypothetical protein